MHPLLQHWLPPPLRKCPAWLFCPGVLEVKQGSGEPCSCTLYSEVSSFTLPLVLFTKCVAVHRKRRLGA